MLGCIDGDDNGCKDGRELGWTDGCVDGRDIGRSDGFVDG